MNVSFIGYGNIAKAIARGLCRQKTYTLFASAPSLTLGINKELVHTSHDNKKIVKEANIIILAVKPAKMQEILKEISPLISPQCLLISVAAGLSLSWLAKQCAAEQPIIRTMPNIPAAIGLAATPLIANEYTSTLQKESAEGIFASIGITTWAKHEKEMDVFTALSGSGPAYVFLFIEAMINAGVLLGLDKSIATNFAFQTVSGALNIAQNSDISLTQLRSNVTSPAGTTAAALNVLDKHLEDLIFKAMEAATNRSHELGAF